jgi:hypothetical protein
MAMSERTISIPSSSKAAAQAVRPVLWLAGLFATLFCVLLLTSCGDVQPAAVLSQLSCSQSSMTGAGTNTCTVTLSAEAPDGGLTVSLNSSSLAVTIPSSITVAAGSVSATFPATAAMVSTPQTATLTASATSLSKTFTLQLNVAAPVITSPASTSGTTGDSFSYQITATGTPTSYGASGLPGGLSLDSSTGLISGAPVAAGASTVTLTATNDGGTGTASMVLTVAPAPPVGGPALSLNASSIAFGDVTLGTPSTQSLTLTSTGTSAVTITSETLTGTGFSVQETTLPLTLNPSQTATLYLQFDPTASGSATGKLTITSNSDTNSTAVVALSGTGQATAYQVALTWDAPVGSTVPVTGYDIYRAVSGSSSYQRLNPSVVTSTTYTDATVADGTSYSYYVVSVDAAGSQSAPSNYFSVVIP